MREHPIIFSAPMVRAILEGRKTQTRRVVRGGQPKGVGTFHVDTGFKGGRPTLVETTPCPAGREIHWLQRMPYGQPGDRLWVRETHLLDPPIDGSWPSVGDGFASIEDIPGRYRNTKHVLYRADNNLSGDWCWRPSIHMPRWASRITLELTDVRVQRVQDISEEDALAEGCRSQIKHSAAFADLWDSINESRGFGWNANPYVWALTFRRVEQSR